MGISQAIKRTATGVAAAGMLTAATLAVSTGPAAAAMGKGRVQLCSQGNYGSYLEFWGNGASTVLVPPGTCLKTNIPSGTQQVEVLGAFNSSGIAFHLGTFTASASDDPGWKVFTTGTTANAGAGAGWYATRN
ncbi:hypothetical protein AB0J84_01835 [Micromonospora arborensis]|uniref:hypothetical protein n=1 Tax=Micromonospora arborensis TaxID=2116518 RepID=UPI003449D308